MSDKTPIFYIICSQRVYLHLEKKFLESDNCKWSKMALKVGHFSRLHSPLQHGEIRKFWKVSHQNTVQPTHCTQETGPKVFPHQSIIYHKTGTPPPPQVCNKLVAHFWATFWFLSKIYMKMNLFDKNGSFAGNLICIATMTYFCRF